MPRPAARKAAPPPSPTEKVYTGLDEAYVYFNRRLFDGSLPSCLITMQRRANSRGYFSGDRFHSPDGREVTDEIALNPKMFEGRTIDDILSTLVHEMCHLWQHHHGNPSRGRYHNKEWAAKMESVGLMPSATGLPGGRRTGQQVTHYIIPNGLFAKACAAFKFDRNTLYHDLTKDREVDRKLKVKYQCEHCAQLALWGKPDAPRAACVACLEAELADVIADRKAITLLKRTMQKYCLVAQTAGSGAILQRTAAQG